MCVCGHLSCGTFASMELQRSGVWECSSVGLERVLKCVCVCVCVLSVEQRQVCSDRVQVCENVNLTGREESVKKCLCVFYLLDKDREETNTRGK